MNIRKTLAFICLATGALYALTACDGAGAVHTGPVLDVESEESGHSAVDEHSSYPNAGINSVEAAENGVYSVAGFSIVIPDAFEKQNAKDLALYAINSANCAVALAVDSFHDLIGMGVDIKMSASEYAKLVAKAIEDRIITMYDKGENAYFEYVRDIEEKRYRYFAYVYKGSSAFYLLQFSCLDEDAESLRGEFERIEKSVIVE